MEDEDNSTPQLLKKLKESEALLEKAQRIAQIGHWKLIPTTGEVTGSDELFRIFDLSPEGASLGSFVDVVHPKDKERNVAAIQRGAEYGESWNIKHRLICRDGVEKWVHAVGEAVIDKKDNVVELVGTVQDITRQTRIEIKLTEHQNHLEDLVKERTADLAKARDEAERSNQTKSEFLSSMSHELRMPLNAILGFAQLLQINREKTLDQRQKDSVNHIIQGGNHLLTLINDVLDLAKIESGNADLSIEDMQINEIIDRCFTFIQSIATESDIRLKKAYDSATSLTVHADHIRTKQILLNLLSNAVKYNLPGGTVIVSCHASSTDTLRIEVVDTGKGIPKVKQHDLFKPFNRLGAEISNVQGTGIGLSVCKNLVELMEGKIGFESNANTGSTFWFELPMVENKLEKTMVPTAKPLEQATQTQLKTINTSLLYVEDNEPSIRLMEAICKTIEGLILTSVNSAEEGIMIAKSNIPDIIILDVNLPGISGIEAVEHIRQAPETAKIPVVGLSASAMQADIDKGLSVGFNMYLTKPIDVDKLIDVLKELMKPGDGTI